jgi:hypothetical protein
LVLEAGDRCTAVEKSCEELDETLNYARRTNVDDFVAYRPDVVLIDGRAVKPYLPAKPFDYIEFLSGDPRFPEVWQDYKKVDSALGYDIWLRTPQAHLSEKADRFRCEKKIGPMKPLRYQLFSHASTKPELSGSVLIVRENVWRFCRNVTRLMAKSSSRITEARTAA